MQQDTGNQGTSGNQGDQANQANTNEPMSQVEIDRCVQDLMTCHDVCLQAASNASGNSSHATMLQDCAELCQTTAHFLQHGDPLYGYVTSAAATVTQVCGERCESMGDSNTANACKSASWSLQQISKMVAY